MGFENNALGLLSSPRLTAVALSGSPGDVPPLPLRGTSVPPGVIVKRVNTFANAHFTHCTGFCVQLLTEVGKGAHGRDLGKGAPRSQSWNGSSHVHGFLDLACRHPSRGALYAEPPWESACNPRLYIEPLLYETLCFLFASTLPGEDVALESQLPFQDSQCFNLLFYSMNIPLFGTKCRRGLNGCCWAF